MPEPRKPGAPVSRRATLIVSAIAVLFVVMPVLFWHSTWFGRSLSDEQISEYLADRENPRQAQHALAQISERIAQGDRSAERWYPQIVALADHPLAQLRMTAAWVMGQDPDSERFHQKLATMLNDPDPMVQRNAALSLAAFGDPAGREQLVTMLKPRPVNASAAGEITTRLKPGDAVDRGTLLARIAVPGREEPAELRSPVPGVLGEYLVEDGSEVEPGEPVVLLRPDSAHVFEALRALYLVGTPQDADVVRPYLRPSGDRSARIARQAQLTLDQIRSRSGS